jgi:hypothetical protein
VPEVPEVPKVVRLDMKVSEKIVSIHRSIPGALAHLGVLVTGIAMAVRIDVNAAGLPALGAPWLGMALVMLAIGWWALGWLLPAPVVTQAQRPELRDVQAMACGGMHYAGPADVAPDTELVEVEPSSVTPDRATTRGGKSTLARA